MPKAVKKPIEIQVKQFTGSSEDVNIPSDIDIDIKVYIYRDEDTKVYKVFNKLHNSWIEVKVGDWLNVTNPGDIYPIDADYFKNNYNLI